MIERARVHTVSKPWGIVDLLPWSNACHDGSAIGEIWYERPGNDAPDTLLLLKLLLTSQPLSIQVHPDDAYAESVGLQNGKTEAWYVLSAAPEAKVALGLKEEGENVIPSFIMPNDGKQAIVRCREDDSYVNHRPPPRWCAQRAGRGIAHTPQGPPPKQPKNASPESFGGL